MKLIKAFIQKVVGAAIILVIVAALFGGCDDTVSKVTDGSMDDNRTTTVTTNGGGTGNVKETEPAETTVDTAEAETTEAETVAVAEIPTEAETTASVRDEGIAAQTMETHGISLDTIKRIVTKYRYGDDTEYTSTFDDYEFLFYFEDSVEEYNYKITEDGYAFIEWETDENIQFMKDCLTNPDDSNVILTEDEVNAMIDEDIIGVYGLFFDYELYVAMAEDDPGWDSIGDPGNTYDVNYDNYKDIARYAVEGDEWNIEYLQIMTSLFSEQEFVGAIIKGDGRPGEIVTVWNDTSTKLLDGDVVTCTATVTFDPYSGDMELHITWFDIVG